MKGKRPKLSLVIPVYNAEASLELLQDRIIKSLAAWRPFEIIYVDDGSRDGSWRVLERLKRKKPDSVLAVRLSRNFGQHNAVLCGLQKSRADLVVTLDDDLQHPPEEIPVLLSALRGETDVVYGRYKSRKHSWGRRLASRGARGLLRLAIPELHPDFSSFRVLRGSVARELVRLNMPFTFIDGGLTWITDRVSSVPVEARPRVRGSSGYRVGSLFSYTLDIVTTFSDLPLRLASLAGFATAGTGFLYGLLIVLRMILKGDLLPGWTSLMAAALFFSGLILTALGILGEYVGRINHKTTGKPRFIERLSKPGSREA